MHPFDLRTGIGSDTHRLVTGRPLILGGVRLDHPMGLLGHSDADVLTHAVCDALLGAAGMGDIGGLFPDSDPAFKDISSLKLLGITGSHLKASGFYVVNIDATVFAQAPRIGPYRKEMEKNIAESLCMDSKCVNIKATTTEGLDAVGRGEGISATAIVLIWQGDKKDGLQGGLK
ncbi:2-C-methyl-D-erythritol 2,4-cyclodiphosphate synthase [Desulfobotulus alkaliphilus]|uniref:2-C-methyl-D-erythritol 2,4-cyclodiphosphate synthase n=1 Tax=Desulfobotulus alkaliphilus TaxID=622671 RepID=A0A562RT76_9BACT|nr:2-C-methyl-D-erythritol 2,4-cyclodiphosphate synthase [Desulfobotulus alkaliphilus]TWI72295.1 2-C-methyl-D-erythritol 2,4-cyclodiphosphate synthase [Desulfobotulus alkaliphilus]